MRREMYTWNTVTVLLTGEKHIYFVVNKRNRYLQFPTKSTTKAILQSISKKFHEQYTVQDETSFSFRLNNRRKDLMMMYNADVIPASRPFFVKYHIINRNGSFIIIEQIRKSTFGEIKKKLLKQIELLDHETRKFKT